MRLKQLWRETIVAFGLDVQIGKKHRPGIWLIRNFLWNTRLVDRHPLIYRMYKWMDDRIIGHILNGKGKE